MTEMTEMDQIIIIIAWDRVAINDLARLGSHGIYVIISLITLK